MCILLFEVRTRPTADEYALVLVSNRDEMYDRPTRVSHFWDDSLDVIGGRDAFPGKEGGTWLAMSKTGKIGVLLNILQPPDEENSQATGRGHLVSEYVTTNSVDAAAYLDELAKRRTRYNSFRLVTVEIRPPTFDEVAVCSYSNVTDGPPTYLAPGIHGFGNGEETRPWRKVGYGRDKFSGIVARHRTVDSKERLIDELLELLGDDTRHLPDSQIEKQGRGKPAAVLQAVSAINVRAPEYKYGTRTNTLILVDGRGDVDFIERTMREPVDARDPQWIVTQHRFRLLNTRAETTHDEDIKTI